MAFRCSKPGTARQAVLECTKGVFLTRLLDGDQTVAQLRHREEDPSGLAAAIDWLDHGRLPTVGGTWEKDDTGVLVMKRDFST